MAAIMHTDRNRTLVSSRCVEFHTVGVVIKTDPLDICYCVNMKTFILESVGDVYKLSIVMRAVNMILEFQCMEMHKDFLKM